MRRDPVAQRRYSGVRQYIDDRRELNGDLASRYSVTRSCAGSASGCLPGPDSQKKTLGMRARECNNTTRSTQRSAPKDARVSASYQSSIGCGGRNKSCGSLSGTCLYDGSVAVRKSPTRMMMEYLVSPASLSCESSARVNNVHPRALAAGRLELVGRESGSTRSDAGTGAVASRGIAFLEASGRRLITVRHGSISPARFRYRLNDEMRAAGRSYASKESSTPAS